MNAIRKLGNLSLLALLLGAIGCAAAYHDYPCGCPPYGYCPPSPLPYTVYCGCPTPAAMHYGHKPVLTNHVESGSEAVDPSSP
jgi:hypothetical protein